MSRSEGKEEAKGVADAKEARLDMGLLAKAERNAPRALEEHERAERLLDSEVLVVFELPDGSEGERHFKMGHTVLLLKSFVEEEYDIPVQSQRLYVGGELMLDPLSLSDFPAISPKNRATRVRVHGHLPDSASKK